MSNQIMHYGLILTIILIGVNATLIVGAGLINKGNDFSSISLASSDYGVSDPNSVNPNNIEEVSVQPTEETNVILSFVSGLVNAIPFVGDVIKWLGEVKNLVANLLFGWITLLQLIGLPSYAQFIIAAPLFGIQVITLLWLLFTGVSSLSGGKI